MEYKLLPYLKNVLEKGSPKEVNLVYGEEEYLIKTLIDKLKERFPNSYTVLWGDELSLEKLFEFSAGGSIFSGGEKALVVLEFNSFVKSLGKRGHSSLINLLKVLKGVFLYAVVKGKLSKAELSKEPYRTITSLGDVIVADRLSKQKVREIVKKKFEREAQGIEDQALEKLIDMCGSNLLALKQESEKLLAFSGGRKVRLEDVEKVCVPWEDAGLFELVDAVVEGDIKGSLIALREVLRKGVSPFQIVATLASYINKLFIVHEMLSRGTNLETALESVGIKHNFLKLKFKRYLDSLDSQRAEALIESLYRLDYGTKVRFLPPDKELEKMVFKVSGNHEG